MRNKNRIIKLEDFNKTILCVNEIKGIRYPFILQDRAEIHLFLCSNEVSICYYPSPPLFIPEEPIKKGMFYKVRSPEDIKVFEKELGEYKESFKNFKKKVMKEYQKIVEAITKTKT